MAEFGSLAAFASFLTGSIVEMEHGKHEALERAAVLVEKEAKSYPGHYQHGWAPLKPETVAKKATGDSPLLETGKMRDSIEHNVSGHEAHIGSNDMNLVYQELGTSRGIPPRPVLQSAAMQKKNEVVHILGAGAVKGLVKP